MILVLLPFIIIAIAGFLIWYLYTIRKHDCDFELVIPWLYAFIAVGSLFGVVLGSCAIADASGWHSEENVALIDLRMIILAELKSTDPVIHNKGISDAIAYNRTVKDGKDFLANPWTNWLTDRIWADAEYIEVNLDEYEIIPESESVENENQ